MASVDIHISDLHVAHKTAIMYPDPDLEWKMNKTQKWLFKCWNTWQDDMWPWIDSLNPDHVHLTVVGETADIDYKKRGSQFWTKNYHTATENAIRLLNPLVEKADAVHVFKGTEAHVGTDGTVDNIVARDFDNIIKANGMDYAWYWAEYDIDGVLFDVAHHGKNRSKWADENLLTALRTEIIKDRVENGRPIPDIVSRGHYHWFGTTSEFKRPLVVSLPPWQIPTEYIYRIDPVVKTPKVGAVVFICDDGEFQVKPFIYTFPRRKPWTFKK